MASSASSASRKEVVVGTAYLQLAQSFIDVSDPGLGAMALLFKFV